MKTRKLLFSIIILFGLFFFPLSLVSAVPPLPSSFYGTVILDEVNVEPGTIVSAFINDVFYASTVVEIFGEDTVYSIDIPGDDLSTTEIEGGVNGDTIIFYIGEFEAEQTGSWSNGTNVQLNLSALSSKGETNIYFPVFFYN